MVWYGMVWYGTEGAGDAETDDQPARVEKKQARDHTNQPHPHLQTCLNFEVINYLSI